MEWVVNATPRPLYPQERDPVQILQEAGWGPGLEVLTFVQKTVKQWKILPINESLLRSEANGLL
jgi:hypothetical protein